MAGRGIAERRSHGWGLRKREEEIERAMAEEAQGHSPLQRQRKKMRERENYGGKMWRSCLTENWEEGVEMTEWQITILPVSLSFFHSSDFQVKLISIYYETMLIWCHNRPPDFNPYYPSHPVHVKHSSCCSAATSKTKKDKGEENGKKGKIRRFCKGSLG